MSDWYQLQLSRLGMLGFSLFVMRRLLLRHSTLWRFLFLHPWFFWLPTMTLSLGRLREKSTLFLCQISVVYPTRGQWKVHRPKSFFFFFFPELFISFSVPQKDGFKNNFSTQKCQTCFSKELSFLSKHICLKRMTWEIS